MLRRRGAFATAGRGSPENGYDRCCRRRTRRLPMGRRHAALQLGTVQRPRRRRVHTSPTGSRRTPKRADLGVITDTPRRPRAPRSNTNREELKGVVHLRRGTEESGRLFQSRPRFSGSTHRRVSCTPTGFEAVTSTSARSRSCKVAKKRPYAGRWP